MKETGGTTARLPTILAGAGERAWDLLTRPAVFVGFMVALLLYNTLGTALLDTWSGLDFWEHLTAVDAFARNPLHPATPYVDAPASHLFTPYHLFWGLIARLAGVSAFALAPAMAAANTLLFGFGVRLLARRLTGDVGLSLPLALAMLFLWLRPYQWSGFHDFGLFPLSAMYPYWLALPVVMITLGAIDESQPARASGLLARALAVALVFLVHPLSGTFLALALSIRALVESGLSTGARLLRIAAVVAGLAATLPWPWFPVLSVVMGARHFASQGFAGDWAEFYHLSGIRLLPAALGTLAFFGAARRRAPAWTFWTLIACATFYVVNPFTLRSAFIARYVIYVAMLLQWAAVLWLAHREDRVHGYRVALFLAVLLPAAALEIRTSLVWIGAPWSGLPHGAAGEGGNRDYVRRFRRYAPYLTSRDVVMAGMEESWILPVAVECRVVGALHSSPFMEDFRERGSAVESFFDPRVSADERSALLVRYGVTRVLVPRRSSSGLDGVSGLPLLFADDAYELRVVRPPSGN